MKHFRQKSIRRLKSRNLRLELLERRALLDGSPIISEFMARNEDTIQDRDGDTPDWLEVFNPTAEAIDLNGYWLTDDPGDLTGWRMPSVTLEPGGYRMIFASGKDRSEPDGELHADFKLDRDAEYLALIAPDGQTVVHEFSPEYPEQVADIAYGVAPDVEGTTLLDANSQVTYLVPTDNGVQQNWILTEFDDAGWKSGPNGLGFDTGGTEDAPMARAITNLEPLGYWRFEETSGELADNLGSAGDALDGVYEKTPGRTAQGPGLAEVLFEFDDNNSATKFNGRNEFVSTQASPLSNLSEFTMMGLISPEATAPRLGLFGQNDAIEFGFLDSSTLQVWTAGGGSLEVGYAFPADEWHHLAVVGDGDALSIYIDGVPAGRGGTATQNYGSSESLFNIGGGSIFDEDERFLDGSIDEVAIFDKALTSEQIANLMGRSDQGPADTNTQFSDLFKTDLLADLSGKGSSLYVRLPFQVDDPSRFNQLVMDVSYDDGFVAYLNGSEVARRNAPGEDDVLLPYDAVAARTRADHLAVVTESIDISNGLGAMLGGDNVLSIHALNGASDNPDLLLRPELTANIVTVDPTRHGYLTTPTPGKNNNPISENLGPIVVESSHSPHEPTTEQSIVVAAEVVPTLQDVASVELIYRVMFGDEVTIAMADNGAGPDQVANDGIYAATIPGGIAEPGEMIRWYVRATDTDTNAGRLPTFEFNEGENQSPEYMGAVVTEPTLSSGIPILQWFVEDERQAGNDRGTRASIYYNSEFYDNVYVRARGGSTQGNAKTNFKFDFKGEQFRFDPQYARVEEFNLNSTASDKAYLRQSLAFDAYSAVGSPGPISFPMHVQRNNEFYGVFAFIEEPDEELLKREGLDPNGALYKHYNEFTAASGSRKKTRKEEGNSDLDTFIRDINALRRDGGEELHNYLLDNVDLPRTLNYLVATVLIHQNDNPHKNHYLYRDSDGTGEWTFMPWDHDLTWGSNWVGTSYSDVIYADVDEITFGPRPGHNLAFIQPSHPFVNAENHREWNNHWNRLMDALLMDPVIQQMYLRRLRTAMDELLGEPGTTDSYFDQKWLDYVPLMSEDAAMDKERWRQFGQDQSFEEAVNIVRTEYMEVRRQHLYVTHSINNSPTETTVILPEFSPARYFVPSDNSLGQTWTARDFDDSQWGAGETGIGFENSPDDFIDLIRTRVKPAETAEDSTSVFIRVPFNVDDPTQIENLTLRMKFDDGFVAYINGTEVERASLRTDGEQFYDSRARSRPASQSAEFSSFVLDAVPSDVLVPGENILAIHGVNSSASNSDLLMLPELVDGIVSNVLIAGIPNAQTGNPPLKFDANLFDANPVSGNQNEEFIKIDNPTEDAVDISGWRIEGGIRHTFRPGTIIAAGSSLYVSPSVREFRARETGPSGGQGLFVQGDYAGHLSNFGESLQLLADDGTVMDQLEIPAAPSDAQQFLRVTEVNYNPRGLDDGATEFIEIHNIGQTELDLTGVTISQGPRDPFVIPAGKTIQAGEYQVIVSDVARFQAAYPLVDAAKIVGEFAGNLDNGGERIKLDDSTGSTIVDFSYGDGDPWPERADGAGGTLVVVDAALANDQFAKYYSWRGSAEMGGSPAAASIADAGVLINEVLVNTDPPAVATDTIEIYNPTQDAIEIGGWYLSDSGENLLKFQIPAGTMLSAGQYMTFDESNFNPTPANPADHHFALDGDNGDDVWLVIPDGNGGVSQFVDDIHFGGQPAGESLGRYPNATGRLTPLTQATFGSENALPRVGPLVISEVNYNPGLPSDQAVALYADIDSGDLEYIEIVNPTGAPLDLSQWRLRGGVDIDSLDTLNAGEAMVVISFNPDSPANVARVEAFRAHYGIDDSVQLVGGYQGQLSDSFDRIRLQRAESVAGEVNHYYEDEVLYDDQAPWPTSADGSGDSLHRQAVDVYGNQSQSWLAASPSPGSFGGPVRGDFDGDGIVDETDINLLFEQMRSGDPDLAFDLTSDGQVDGSDRDELILNILRTQYGDSNLDKVFNSSDLVTVFRAGKYETGAAATWQEGDWGGDGFFLTGDLVLAFREGGYTPARPTHQLADANVAAALEPTGMADHKLGDRPLLLQAEVSDPVRGDLGQMVDLSIRSLFEDEPVVEISRDGDDEPVNLKLDDIL